MTQWKPLVEAGRLPAALVAKGVKTYMQGPLERWLGAETLAKKVAEDVEGLVTRKAALHEEAEKALEAATTRTERQGAKAASFQKREEFFTQAIALLDTHIEGDRVIINSLEGDGTPEVEKAHKEVQTLIKDVAAMRQHIAAKGLSFVKDPKQLHQTEVRLRSQLDANTVRLQASLAETIRLLQEHTALQTELTGVQVDQTICEEVHHGVEAARKDLCGAVDAEAVRLSEIQEAVSTFTGASKSIAEKIRAICYTQQHQAHARVKENAKHFAQLYTEFYSQLQELHAGKLKCTKALQVELNRLKKEQGRWEELEHEVPGAQQLAKLDERLTQIQEFKEQLVNEVDVLSHKIETLNGCGPEILSLVPGYVHPAETFGLARTEQLDSKRQKLESELQRYGPFQIAEEDLCYESSSADTSAEPSRPLERHVVESPFKLRRHLRRVVHEIQTSPFAARFGQAPATDNLPVVATPQVTPPTPDMLHAVRLTPYTPETRGGSFRAPKRRRVHKHGASCAH
eukprot:TRINITY_DN4843_c0_g1_i1.p2 TRINITY_DN4843_c0_g1~~TRINITY_DN4843_c0_g1_i1.p2  ORF type:complete len:514 (+),score=170.69 TRINITY_DN4843_c0_g1_i1:342-1883(+)